ncbi:MAG: hypothetical protein NTV48_01720, partial [Candidatus Vogelbacteria bacterium]|nr:hypothetical protein [Candidatus Vogelbacteria bacterium]
MKSTEDWSNLVFIFFTIAVIGFGGYQYYGLSSRHTVTLSQLASSTEKINQLEAIVAQNKQENTDLNTSLV